MQHILQTTLWKLVLRNGLRQVFRALSHSRIEQWAWVDWNIVIVTNRGYVEVFCKIPEGIWRPYSNILSFSVVTFLSGFLLILKIVIVIVTDWIYLLT